MKLQNLAVIFIIIIMPIIIVFSEYMNTQLNILKTEEQYDLNLLNSTYDAVKAFQINTVNTSLYTSENRVKNAEASVNTFFNSLITSFNMEGNSAETMKEYVPATVMTLYDGYYIYSPFTNTLTNVKEEQVDDEYKNGKVIDGLKPFITYSCKYSKGNKQYIINYTLDNYIAVDVFESGEFKIHKEGYLIDGITKSEDAYIYDGITFKKGDNEVLREYLKLEEKPGFYYYTIIDGTKYYYEPENPTQGRPSKASNNDKIFYIDDNLSKHYQFTNRVNQPASFDVYFNSIFKNNSAYKYYENAYIFTNWAKKEENLGSLTVGNLSERDKYGKDIFPDSKNNDTIFVCNENTRYQYSNSNFNRHRKDVIRAIITTNLSTAISGFSKYVTNNAEFIMPKISETNWELLENNICMATFLQGMKVGGKTYNNCAIVPINYSKEFVSENDIYLLVDDGTGSKTYTKANDTTIKKDNLESKNKLGYQPAIASINFEVKRFGENRYYNPMSYVDKDNKLQPYLESYTSIEGGAGLGDITTIDMYRYMEKGTKKNNGETVPVPDTEVKTAYYTALARERESSYKFSKEGLEVKEQYEGRINAGLKTGVTVKPEVTTKVIRKDGKNVQVAVYPFTSGSDELFEDVLSPLPEKEGYICTYFEEEKSGTIINTVEDKDKDLYPDSWIEENTEGTILKPTDQIPEDWYDDIYVEPHFEPIQYEVVYNGNDATSGSMPNSIHTYDKDKKLSKNTYTRTGYSFNGWAETIHGNTKYSDQQSVRNLMSKRGKYNLYAVWSANEYTVTLEGNGGTDITIKKYFDEPLGELPESEREGYTFDGWYTEKEGGEKITPETILEEENPTYYAHWSGNTYTINYYNGTILMGSSSHVYGTASNLKAVSSLSNNQTPITSGVFNGWTTSTSAITRTYTDGQSVNNLTTTKGGTITLYAIWQRNATFYEGANKTATTKIQYYNSKGGNYYIDAYTPATITNWSTLGWRADTTATTAEYASANAITASNTNYYGVYSRDLTITYNGNKNTSGSTANTVKTIYINANNVRATTSQQVTLAKNGFARSTWSYYRWTIGNTDYQQNTCYNPNLAYNASSFTVTAKAKWSCSGTGLTCTAGYRNYCNGPFTATCNGPFSATCNVAPYRCTQYSTGIRLGKVRKTIDEGWSYLRCACGSDFWRRSYGNDDIGWTSWCDNEHVIHIMTPGIKAIYFVESQVRCRSHGIKGDHGTCPHGKTANHTYAINCKHGKSSKHTYAVNCSHGKSSRHVTTEKACTHGLYSSHQYCSHGKTSTHYE